MKVELRKIDNQKPNDEGELVGFVHTDPSHNENCKNEVLSAIILQSRKFIDSPTPVLDSSLFGGYVKSADGRFKIVAV
jgi:hypothetical protein